MNMILFRSQVWFWRLISNKLYRIERTWTIKQIEVIKSINQIELTKLTGILNLENIRINVESQPLYDPCSARIRFSSHLQSVLIHHIYIELAIAKGENREEQIY